jgi:hypothetical protein
MAKSDIAPNEDWIAEEIAKNYDKAKARGDAYLARHPRAVKAWYHKDTQRMYIGLNNGVDFSFPTELAQGLRGANAAALSKVELLPFGTGLHWPLLDADLSVAGLLAGIFGSKVWMKEIASKGGQSTSQAKSTASRANGLKGGRPPTAAKKSTKKSVA